MQLGFIHNVFLVEPVCQFSALIADLGWIELSFSLLVLLRCIITGMASGSIVLFYNDFNRWHHEYQTRY